MIVLDRFTADEWKVHSEKAHLICFGNLNPAERQRIDFALVGRENDLLMAYGTFRELDGETVYWQFGGAFPGTKDTTASWRTFNAFLAYLRPKYKRVCMFVENNNLPMLKMAMKASFLIMGVRNYKDSILLEHLLEFPI